MIELYKFGESGKICDPSPFCAKVETYLKMSGTPYESHSGLKYLKRAPKGKLPFIKDEGKSIADSTFIIRHLEEKNNHPLNAHLSEEQKAVAHGFTRMIDENLYWTIVYARWILDHNWVILKEMFFGSLGFPLKIFVPGMVRKSVLKGMKGHGIARHSADEITEIGRWDMQALSDYLADKEYFFGDKPSTLDAAVYGALCQMILESPFQAPVFEKAKEFQNLVDFTHRIQKKYFSDLS